MSAQLWTCSHCKQPIDQFSKAKVLSEGDKVLFFHLNCYPSWNKNQQAYRNRLKQDEFMR